MNAILIKKTALLFCTAGLLLANVAQADPHPKIDLPIKSETLLHTSTSWDGVAYKAYPDGTPELTVLKLTIRANTSLPWHKHPMPVAAYLVSGKLTIEKKNGEKKSFAAGQVLAEAMEQVHRGVTGDEPAELIIFYAGTKGLTLMQD